MINQLLKNIYYYFPHLQMNMLGFYKTISKKTIKYVPAVALK